MRLTKADILHATMIGLTLVASAICASPQRFAIAIPVIASGDHQSVVGSNLSSPQPLIR
jgi:hypothetical protein